MFTDRQKQALLDQLCSAGRLSPVVLSVFIGDMLEWSRWKLEIPFIPFKPEWQVKIIPPYFGAVVRFLVKRSDQENHISIYLDCYDLLGVVGEPYWEVCDTKSETFRCKMHDIPSLINLIEGALENGNA